MKGKTSNIRKTLLIAPLLLVIIASLGQTPLDTVKPGNTNDPMVVNPGESEHRMPVKPAQPMDGMSVMSDTAFLRKHLLDNTMEIQLATLGQKKGTSPEVKKVAALIIKDHKAILNDFVRLAAKKSVMSGKSPHEMTTPAATLPEGEFDAWWAGQMLRMHEAKIAELETFINLTKNAELKAAVMNAIPKIKAHRELLLRIPGAKEKSKVSGTI